MRIRRNDSNNDWCFGSSQADFLVDNNLGVAQNIKTKLQEWKNDFFGNLQAGIDWRVRLGLKGQRKELDADIKKVITSIKEVMALTKYESYYNDREYTVTLECYTIYSELPLTIQTTIEGI